MDEHQKELLKNLPKIDEMMLRIEKRGNLAGFPREIVKEACRSVVEELRARILAAEGGRRKLPATRKRRRSRRQVVEGPIVSVCGGDQRDGVIIHQPRPRAAFLPRGLGTVVEVARDTPTWSTTWRRGRGLRYDHVGGSSAPSQGPRTLGRQQQRRRGPSVLNSLAEGDRLRGS
jgi:hypothetical protein